MSTKTRRVLGRQNLKDVADRTFEYVDVDDLPGFAPGDCVRLRSLQAAERVDIELKCVVYEQRPDNTFERIQNESGLRERLIAVSMVDDDGQAIYPNVLTDQKAMTAAVAELGQRSFAFLNRVFGRVQKLSGIGKGAERAAGEGSSPAQKNDSFSGSPDTSTAPSPNSADVSAVEN